MPGMRVLVALLAALAMPGCTAIFGLDDVPSVDGDNDGMIDDLDNCPQAFNPDQSDFDKNEIGDACDVCAAEGADDLDGDDIPDACDGCIGNGQDADRDRIDDGCDPCQNTNRDVDEDGVDDGCDACIGENTGIDVDADGVDDSCDQCIGTGRDDDADLIDDGCDPCLSTAVKTDIDADSIEDACDTCASADATDIDADGIQDVCDACACYPVNGCANYIDHDEDGDHYDDGCDNCRAVPNPQDQGVIVLDDSVGAACDPDESRPDREYFDSFATPDLAWFYQGPAWALANDATSVYVAGQLPAYRMLDFPVTGSFKTRARIDGRELDQLSNSQADVSLFLADAITQPAPNQLGCKLTVLATGPSAPAARVSIFGMVDKSLTVLGGPSAAGFSPEQVFDLVFDKSLDAGKILCGAYALDGTQLAVVTIGAVATTGLDYPGIAVQVGYPFFLHYSVIGPN